MATESRADRERERPGLYANTFYTPEEVALLLDLSRSTVYRLIGGDDPEIKSVKVGARARRVYGRDILDYFLADRQPMAAMAADRPGLFLNAFYTPQEAADLLGLSTKTVYRLVESDEADLVSKTAREHLKSIRIYGGRLAVFLGIPEDLVPLLPRSEQREA